MPRLNHRQVEAFRAVIIAGTVTGAADVLCISQPAVSRLIADFERAIGIPVFRREKGRLIPTSEGRILYEEVEKSFVSIDKIAQVADELQGLHRGTLRIAAMPALALTLLPALIHDFTRQQTGVGVSLQVRSSQKVVEWISAQYFDIGFTAIGFADAAVQSEVLARSRLVCVLPPGHSLASEAVICPSMLANEVFVSLGTEQRVRYSVDEVFDLARVSRNMSIDTQLSYTACAFVAAGAGVALVDPITALNFRAAELVVRPFEPRVGFDYSVIFPALRPRSRLAQAFFEMARKRIADQALESGGLFEMRTGTDA